ncbi:MAG: hypothetical protein JO146_05655 [Candidatus Eremiobacteraeota bacterium]|nr:hypothetical protein [Candidatus Eremiobacteraeota bacterium]
MIPTALLRIIALATIASFGGAHPPVTPSLDPCTVVAAEMMESVDSSEARPGDFFRFQTVNAVTAGTSVIIPERTLGYGVVTVASPAGRDAHPGVLVLEPRYLTLPNGKRLGVVLNHNVSGDPLDRSGSSNGIPGYLGAIPLLGVGAAIGIFNYFRKGKNIVVPRGTVFTIFPSDDPSVEHCQEHPSY